MGSPISPIIANIFMEAFERKALATALHPPRVWRRYVDDTWVIQQQEHKQQFLQHINTVDDSIQFTVEEAKEDGNLRKDEIIAMKQLKADKNRMVLTADKGVALVVMDTVEYIKKAKDILEDTNTYRVIQTDPTNKLKSKLINILRRTKAATGLQENIYRRM